MGITSVDGGKSRAYLRQIAQAIQETSRIVDMLNDLHRADDIELLPLRHEILRCAMTILQ